MKKAAYAILCLYKDGRPRWWKRVYKTGYWHPSSGLARGQTRTDIFDYEMVLNHLQACVLAAPCLLSPCRLDAYRVKGRLHLHHNVTYNIFL